MDWGCIWGVWRDFGARKHNIAHVISAKSNVNVGFAPKWPITAQLVILAKLWRGWWVQGGFRVGLGCIGVVLGVYGEILELVRIISRML